MQYLQNAFWKNFDDLLPDPFQFILGSDVEFLGDLVTQFSVPPFPICRDNRNSSLQISDSSSEKWQFIRLKVTAKIYQLWIITAFVGSISPVLDGDSSEKKYKQKTLNQLYHNSDNKTPKTGYFRV